MKTVQKNPTFKTGLTMRVEEILKDFENLPFVCAIATGGSVSAKTCDNLSDIDVYIFTGNDIPVSEREKIIKNHFYLFYKINGAGKK